jgi:multicomponent Na+:H+ antiporter subunit B
MKGMTVIVKKTTQLIAGLVFLYGIYVIIHGHLTPGGGFAGGVILAGSFILLILAYGSDFINLTKEEAGSTLYENLATLIVIFLAISGLLIGARVFFLNWLPGALWVSLSVPGYCLSTIFLLGLKLRLQSLRSFLLL